MKLNFRKISAVIASGLMTVSAVGFAAAANFPAPFVVGGSADAAVVYGTGAGALDQTPANSVGNYLASKVTSGGGTPTGESVALEKTSDHLNLANGFSDVFTSNVDDGDLPILLADGTYIATDNDEFAYTQKISLGNPTLNHTRDSNYEELIGVDTKTPFVGFKIVDNTYILNYTLDFTTNAKSDIVGTDMDDIEGSDLTLFGKTYYVSDLKNSTNNGVYAGVMTLLDSATIATVSEGETVSVTSGGTNYDVSISFIDSNEVKFLVNGKEASTNKLQKGDSAKLSDGAYIGVRDVSKLEVSGETGSATFSIGSGKLEITSGDEIQLNDATVDGVYGFVHMGTSSSGVEEIDKIVIEWRADDEQYLTPVSELVMPGFGGLKFTMADLVRPEEEKVIIDSDSNSIELSVPLKDGTANMNILYGETSTGNFTGIGKANDERLATSTDNVMTVYYDDGSNGRDKYFIVTYNVTAEAESYLLELSSVKDKDSGHATNRTYIKNAVTGDPVCDPCIVGDSNFEIGSASVDLTAINWTTGGIQSVTLTAGTNVQFESIFTKGGLEIYLPYVDANTSEAKGAINFTGTGVSGEGGPGKTGHNMDTWYLWMQGEDKYDNLRSGTAFNFTIDDDGTATRDLQVTHLDGATTGGPNGWEVGSGTNSYEAYIIDDVAPRIMHYTDGTQDTAEVYYPSGDSETYAKVYLTSASSSLSGAGSMVFKDSEKTSWQSKNVVVVGGSCINSAAADLLGGALCEGAFTDATGAGAGQYVVESYGDAFTTGKIALLVAGYHAADTVAAASRLIEPGVSVDTTAGTKYIGTVGVSGSSTMAKQ